LEGNAGPETAFGLGQVYQYGPDRIRSAAVARKIMGILVDHGWLERIPDGCQDSDGKWHREAWRLVE
jgi:hypothetical protein